jgi:hypothetical protein
MDNLARLRCWIFGALIAVAVASSLVATLLGSQQWDGFSLNFGTEMAGAVVTYALFELIIERRERRAAEKQAIEEKRKAEKEAIEKRKADLIARMGSNVKDVVVHAANELRRQGWLTDGSLEGAKLSRANLEGAKLWDADLQGTKLVVANLEGAELSRANLEGPTCGKPTWKGPTCGTPTWNRPACIAPTWNGLTCGTPTWERPT